MSDLYDRYVDYNNKIYNKQALSATVVRLMEQWVDVFKKKNQDYGNSYKKTGEIMDILLDGQDVNFDNLDGVDYNILALIIRIIDKLCRFTNLYFGNKEMKVDEALVETLGDMGTYSFMAAGLIEEEK